MDLFKTITGMIKEHDDVLLNKGSVEADDYLANFLRSLNNDTAIQIRREERENSISSSEVVCQK